MTIGKQRRILTDAEKQLTPLEGEVAPEFAAAELRKTIGKLSLEYDLKGVLAALSTETKN